MIEIIIAAFLTILVVRWISLLRESSLNRIWAIPALFVSLCFIISHILRVEQNTPMRYVFISYILYQLINLANTSRRVEKFLFLNQVINGDNETNQRIKSLLKSRIISREDDYFKKGRSSIFLIYYALARIILSTRNFDSPKS